MFSTRFPQEKELLASYLPIQIQQAHDEDFYIALQENTVIVEKQRRQVVFLQSLISAHAHVPTPSNAPVTSAAPKTDDEEGVYL